jgi:hypothetical protein
MRNPSGELLRHRLFTAQDPAKIRSSDPEQLGQLVPPANLDAQPPQVFKRLFHCSGDGSASWRKASAARKSFIRDASAMRLPSRKPASV